MGPSESTVVIKKTTPASIQTLLGDFIRHWVRVLLHASWTVKLWHGTKKIRKSCHSRSLAHAKERRVHYFNVTGWLSFWVKRRCTLKLGYSRPSLFMGLHIAILHISGRIIMATLVHCIIGLSLIFGLACTGLWSNTQEAICVCLLHSETRCGLQGIISILYFPKAR